MLDRKLKKRQKQVKPTVWIIKHTLPMFRTPVENLFSKYFNRKNNKLLNKCDFISTSWVFVCHLAVHVVLVKLSFLVSCNDPESYSSCYLSPGLASGFKHVTCRLDNGKGGEGGRPYKGLPPPHHRPDSPGWAFDMVNKPWKVSGISEGVEGFQKPKL